MTGFFEDGAPPARFGLVTGFLVAALGDITELAFVVLSEAAERAKADLLAITAEAKAINRQKSGIRDLPSLPSPFICHQRRFLNGRVYLAQEPTVYPDVWGLPRGDGGVGRTLARGVTPSFRHLADNVFGKAHLPAPAASSIAAITRSITAFEPSTVRVMINDDHARTSSTPS